jgi:WD40 repeat protein
MGVTLADTARPSDWQKVKRCEFSWKPDGSLLALANTDGSVEVLAADDYAIVASFSNHTKLVNALAWNTQFGDAAGTITQGAGGWGGGWRNARFLWSG